METKKVYKVLVEEENGRLVSCIVGGTSTWKDVGADCKELVYNEGEITYAPEGSMGVFVDDSISRAKCIAADRGGSKKGVRVIYEAIPLGKRVLSTGYFFWMLRYPAILLGKEVWRAEPKYVNPFKVGDRVRVKAEVSEPKHSWGGLKFDDIGVVKTVDGDRLEVTFPSFYGGRMTWSAHAPEMELAPNKFKVGDRVRLVSSFRAGVYGMGCVKAGDVGQVKVERTSRHSAQVNFPNMPITYHVLDEYLELAPEPKEEWVDVTKEVTCSVSGYGQDIAISHNGQEIGLVGLLPFAPLCCKGTYKVEEVCRGFSPQIIGGKILKKVTK